MMQNTSNNILQNKYLGALGSEERDEVMKDVFRNINSKDIFKNKGDIDKGGFFDLPSQVICKDPEHNVPSMLHIPQGKGYRHVCPACGKVQIVIPQQFNM